MDDTRADNRSQGPAGEMNKCAFYSLLFYSLTLNQTAYRVL